MAGSRGEVTVLLDELRSGSKDALERLIPLVYSELRRRLLVDHARGRRALKRDMAKAWMKTQFDTGGSR
jgi:hypothetical protein